MITQSINLNLVPGGVLPRINVSQYDKGTRTLEFTLYNGSVLFSIPDDVTITIQGTKADSTGFQYECTFEDSVVTSDLSEQMTVFAGEVVCELVLTQGTNILGTANFILNVEAAALSDDTVISDTDLPLLQEAIEAAAEAAASAEEAANNASAAEESSEDSEAYARGTRGGIDVTSDDPAYHNNAKYYAESVAEAIENLDVSDTAVAGAYVTAVSETDGKISVTRETADTIPTENSTKMVTSGGVYTELNELSSEISTLTNQVSSLEEENGYYNLCPPLTNILMGTGISWQLKDDMSLVANGTATSMNQIATEMFTLEAGTYKINGLPSGGGTSSTFKMWLLDYSSGTETALAQMTGTSDYTFTVTANNKLVLRADIYNTYVASNLNFKPMIRKSDRTSNTYIPYRAKNLKLTQKTIGLWDNMMDNGAVNYLFNANGSASINQVDFDVDSDNIVTLSGTASSSGARYFIIGAGYAYSSAVDFKPGLYRFSGTPKTTPNNDVYMEAGCYNSAGNVVGNNGLFVRIGANEAKSFEVPENSKVVVLIWIPAGINASGLVFKPMLSDPSLNLSYDDYVPYAKTNKELTDFVNLSDSLNDETKISVADSSVLEITACKLSRKGNVLCGFVMIKCKTALPYNTLLFTLPAGFRPSEFCNLMGIENTTYAPEMSMFGLWNSGAVQLQCGIASATKYIRIQIIGAV